MRRMKHNKVHSTRLNTTMFHERWAVHHLIKAKKARRWREMLEYRADFLKWEREVMGRIPPWAK